MTALRMPRRPSFFTPLTGASVKQRERVIIVGLLLLAVVYPLVFRSLQANLGFLPWPDTAVLTVACTFAVLALGLNIVMGFAGLLDLGYVAFYAIGAYTTAFLASGQFGIHISWWIVVWIAVGAAAMSGILLGTPTLRLRGDYLAIVTLGFGEIVRIVFRNLGDFTLALPAFLGGAVLIGPNANLTGGNVGINPIDPPSIPIPGPWGNQLVFSNQNPIAAFYLIVVLMILTYFFCVRLRVRGGQPRKSWQGALESHACAGWIHSRIFKFSPNPGRSGLSVDPAADSAPLRGKSGC